MLEAKHNASEEYHVSVRYLTSSKTNRKKKTNWPRLRNKIERGDGNSQKE